MTDNLTPLQSEILTMIRDNPDRFDLIDLADALFSTPDSVKVIISRLRAKGYKITSPRHRDPTGPRAGIPQTYRLEA